MYVVLEGVGRKGFFECTSLAHLLAKSRQVTPTHGKFIFAGLDWYRFLQLGIVKRLHEKGSTITKEKLKYLPKPKGSNVYISQQVCVFRFQSCHPLKDKGIWRGY